MTARTCDTAIIGGGAIGLSCAYALASAGVGVTVLERDHVGAGASAGTACMVAASHSDRTASPASLREGLRYLLDPKAPLKLRPKPSELPWIARFTAASLDGDGAHAGTAHLQRMAVRSTELHQAWAAALGTGLRMNGTLNIWSGPDAEAERAALVEETRHAGLAIEELDAAGVAALEPSVRPGMIGAIAPGDGHVDSLVFTQRVADGARNAGAEVLEGVEVIRIDRTGARIRLETTAGAIVAERLVIAAGVWSRRFAGDLGLGLPISPAKGYHVEFAGVAPEAQRPIYLSSSRCVATPLEGRLRIAGTLEIGTDTSTIDLRRVEALREAGQRHLVGVPDEASHVWLGLRPMSADAMPMIGPHPGDPRVLIAAGHGMLGITLAPCTAELIAGHVTGALPAADPLVDPARFR
jgi:D-amino-acid dehydrogenase